MSLRILALCLVVSFSGCGGSGATAPAVNCPAITGVGDPNATLVSPAKGATGVPVTIGTITFTVSLSVLRQGNVTLATSSSPPVQLTSGPISTDANGLSSTTIPVLQPHTTYQAFISVRPIDPVTGCQGAAGGNLGSFTTQ